MCGVHRRSAAVMLLLQNSDKDLTEISQDAFAKDFDLTWLPLCHVDTCTQSYLTLSCDLIHTWYKAMWICVACVIVAEIRLSPDDTWPDATSHACLHNFYPSLSLFINRGNLSSCGVRNFFAIITKPLPAVTHRSFSLFSFLSLSVNTINTWENKNYLYMMSLSVESRSFKTDSVSMGHKASKACVTDNVKEEKQQQKWHW